MSITVLVAEDMHMVRGALVALLGLAGDIEVVAEVARGDEVVDAIARHRPAVTVLDIDLPGIDGLSLAGELRDTGSPTRVLILTALARPGMLRAALTAGAHGFMLKDAPPERLADAVRTVAAGSRVIDPDLAAAAFNLGDCPLTRRELDVLIKASEGADVKEIADTLFLSAGTVRNYLTSSVAKLGARNRLDAIRVALEAGWIPPARGQRS
jgi:two-component system response regulator DesR